jgi:hypothetical protein
MRSCCFAGTAAGSDCGTRSNSICRSRCEDVKENGTRISKEGHGHDVKKDLDLARSRIYVSGSSQKKFHTCSANAEQPQDLDARASEAS